MPTARELENDVNDAISSQVDGHNPWPYYKLPALQRQIEGQKQRLKTAQVMDTTYLEQESKDLAFQYGRRHGEHAFDQLANFTDLTFSLAKFRKRDPAVRRIIEAYLKNWEACDFEAEVPQIDDDIYVHAYLPKFMAKDELEAEWMRGFEQRRVQRGGLRDDLVKKVKRVLLTKRNSTLLPKLTEALNESNFHETQVGKWIRPSQKFSYGQFQGVDGVYAAHDLAAGALFLSGMSQPLRALNLTGQIELMENAYQLREAALLAISDVPRFRDAFAAAERGAIRTESKAHLVEAVLTYQVKQGIEDPNRSFGMDLEDFAALPILLDVFARLQTTGSLPIGSQPEFGATDL